MQSMLNLHASYGLPLSISSITQHFIISKEVADHEHRREAMKKRRSRRGSENCLHANQEVGVDQNLEREEETMEAEIDEDRATVFRDLTCTCLVCAAKAA